MTSASSDLNYGMKDLLKLDICQTVDAAEAANSCRWEIVESKTS